MTLTVVTGPPTGGKSTYIRERAKPGDVVVDLDRIALALTTEGTEHHDYPRHITTVAVAARRAAIDAALSMKAPCSVWIIDTRPSPEALERYRAVGADIVLCDPGRTVVTERARRERPPHIAKVIDTYYGAGSTRLRW